ncbi:MAG TPA: glycosyltransferase [Acidimicrobiia bacterium]
MNIVTPWYPSPAHPYNGVFVQQQADALRRLGATVEVEVPEIFPAPRGPVPQRVFDAMSSLARSTPRAMFRQDDSVTRIPAAVPSQIGALGRARAFEESLRLRRGVDSPSFDVTHAHLGVPTGLAVIALSDAPVVITEHQSALPRLLEDEAIRRVYRTLIERCATFLTVSSTLRDAMLEALGPIAADVEVLPNIVDFDALPARDDTPTDYRKWIYVGTLVEHKGVGMLLDAFTTYQRNHDADATLTLVGDGPMRGYIEAYADRHGIEDHLTLHGGLPHRDVARHLANADVLVHLSPFETFGIAPIEAIATGTPVVVRENGGSTYAWGDIASRCGLLLEPDVTAGEVADAIAELRDRPNTLDLPSARRVMTDRYSAGVIGGRLLEIYESHAA